VNTNVKIKKHTLDVEKSLGVYADNSDAVLVKACYHNVFRMISRYPKEFRDGEWRIAYGCIKATEGIYARHCFIVTEDGTAIDPTAGTWKNAKLIDKEYISCKVFTISEYFDALEENDSHPSLEIVLLEAFDKLREWALERDSIVAG